MSEVEVIVKDIFTLLPKSKKYYTELINSPVSDDLPENLVAHINDWNTSQPILLLYQKRWIADQSQFKLYVKSRRTGISWATALEAVLTSSAQNGMNSYYSGYNYSMAYQFIRDCEYFAKALDIAVGNIEAFLFDEDADKSILSYKIKFASGKEIVALSSKPTNFRSKQGFVILDEFAFMPSPEEMLKAVMALLMWGGRVAIVSTHNGISSVFNQLINQAESGEKDISIHRTDLDNALADGLYKRICLVSNKEWTIDNEFTWRLDLIKQYGVYAQEELFCIPSTNSDRLFETECIDTAFTGDWEERKNHHYYMMAIDPAFGGADNFVAGVFDITKLPYRLVAEYSDNYQSTKQNKNEVKNLIDKYKIHFVAIEKNSGGVVVAENIAEDNPKITIEMISTSHMNKLVNTDALAVSMSNGEILFPGNWKGHAEFESFSKKLREALVGHDDRVMMAAIARAFFQQAIELMPKPSRSIAAPSNLQKIKGIQ